MHLKAYAIDGALLRTGSANLSPSGLKQQDNDLVILRDPVLAAKFEARFAEVYSAAEPRPDLRKPPPPGETLVRSKATSTLRASASITSPAAEIMSALSWRTVTTRVSALKESAISARRPRQRR